ncbi:MAG TPA: glycosyltransferase family 4 protein [Elusimicrobiota bacterium]|nr:glycosyltransferase family 4 protein [Elusimicrobiota bacterium]
MNPFRIVHLDTEPTWRGGERQLFWLARELKKRGHQNWVACRTGSPLADRCRAADLQVFEFAPKGEWDLRAASALRRFLREQKADILHAHTAHAVGLGAVAAWPVDCGFLATRRVDFPLRRNIFSRWKYGRLNEIVAISEKVRDVMLEHGWHGPKISVIHSGIDPADYPSPGNREDLRRAKGIRNEDLLLVNVAALVPHKDQETLIKAVELLRKDVPAIQLLILGEGHLRSRLTRLIDQLGLKQCVHLLGHRDDVLDYVAAADVFVLSSVEEGLGTSLLDAMSLGIPAVATQAGGIPEIFGDSANDVLVPSRNPSALAAALGRVIGSDDEKQRRVRWGRERLAFFTVARMANQYLDVYQRVNVRHHEKTQRHHHHA